MPYCIQCGHIAHYTIPHGDSRERLVCSQCHHIHYDNPKVIAGVLAIHDNKILLCRRAIEPRYGFWTLPAGFLELGESMRAGAIRETLEEADAIAINAQLYALFDLPDVGQIHVMYLAQLQEGRFGVGTESLECRLFAPEDIPWDELSFRTVRLTLEYYCQDINRQKTNHQNINDLAPPSNTLVYTIHETVLKDCSNLH